MNPLAQNHFVGKAETKKPANKPKTFSTGAITALCAKGSAGNDESLPSCLTKQKVVIAPVMPFGYGAAGLAEQTDFGVGA